MNRVLAAAWAVGLVASNVAPAAAAITAGQINDISNFAGWARTATVQNVAALKGGSTGLYDWTMRPSVPTGHMLTLCSIAERHAPSHGPMTDTGAGCFGPSAAVRNAQTQAACRRFGIATIGPRLPGWTHAWHGSTSAYPVTSDVWTLGRSRVHFNCRTSGTYGYGITPEFDIDLELTVGSQPFLPY